ncbi:MAG: riboflavin biosynthesis protein RibD [Anaerolineales bacterium]|nr:dihydrofolate reductase [Anaerolineae bacterium]PWB50204.1 MAG: riboflavin biosynthesis protein RibD [Anaerolineales bacterium]
MRKLIVNAFVTLDGVMQAPGGPPEDPTGGFNYGGWSVNYWDEIMGQTMGEYMAKPSELLLGRKTYEIFAAHWPFSHEEPAASVLNRSKKYVASKATTHMDWQNTTLIKGDVVQEIRKLKAEDGPELSVQGSSNFIQTLLQHNLVDEFRIWIFPVVIGKGKRLFGEGTIPSSLKLIDSKASSTGVIIARYEPAGEIKIGTFELEKPSEAELARRKRLAEEG